MIRRSRLKVAGPRIDYSVLKFPKGPSVQLEKGWKHAKFEADLRRAYERVNYRDENHSRVTGRVLLPSTKDDQRRREHNHLGRRSTYPSLKTAVQNIFLCSTYEHGFITRNELLIHGTDANQELRFYWNPRIFKPGVKVPFRIPAAVRYEPGRTAAA